MMKKLALTALVFVLAPAPFALADDGAGCGLGKLAWDQYSGKKKIIPQTLAATTNGTFWSQLFGITSQTSGCTNDGIVMNDQKVPVFADANLDSLKQDMAQGRGEYLASLATLMGVPADRQEAFFSLTQAHYATLFPSEHTTASYMLAALRHELSAPPVLIASVR